MVTIKYILYLIVMSLLIDYFEGLSKFTFKLSQKNCALFEVIPFSLSISVNSFHSRNLLFFFLQLILSAVPDNISSRND